MLRAFCPLAAIRKDRPGFPAWCYKCYSPQPKTHPLARNGMRFFGCLRYEHTQHFAPFPAFSLDLRRFQAISLERKIRLSLRHSRANQAPLPPHSAPCPVWCPARPLWPLALAGQAFARPRRMKGSPRLLRLPARSGRVRLAQTAGTCPNRSPSALREARTVRRLSLVPLPPARPVPRRRSAPPPRRPQCAGLPPAPNTPC
ncbi:MAG: hypothetical protein BWY57_02555 [Betaproteobacteria bacterium ADurb.Bin341]|nr:MAG: hypothetical protein BWY57_02555 [Betaproteobacteria bacterium ADurb.Bin341]